MQVCNESLICTTAALWLSLISLHYSFIIYAYVYIYILILFAYYLCIYIIQYIYIIIFNIFRYATETV